MSDTYELAYRIRAAARRPASWLQLLKFGVVGGSGYLINLAVFAVLAGGLGLHHLAAAVGAFCVALANNFLWNRHWTFEAGHGHPGFQAARFFAVSVAALLINLAVLEAPHLGRLDGRSARPGDRGRGGDAVQLPRQQALDLRLRTLQTGASRRPRSAGSGHALECAPLTSLPASTDLLGFRALSSGCGALAGVGHSATSLPPASAAAPERSGRGPGSAEASSVSASWIAAPRPNVARSGSPPSQASSRLRRRWSVRSSRRANRAAAGSVSATSINAASPALTRSSGGASSVAAVALLTNTSSSRPFTSRAVLVPSLMLGPPLQVSAGPRGVTSTAGAAFFSSRIHARPAPGRRSAQIPPICNFFHFFDTTVTLSYVTRILQGA